MTAVAGKRTRREKATVDYRSLHAARAAAAKLLFHSHLPLARSVVDRAVCGFAGRRLAVVTEPKLPSRRW